MIAGLQALLRAIATRIIPGLPLATRISNLQQTAAEDDAPRSESNTGATDEFSQKNAVQYVLDSDTKRKEIQAELDSK